MNEEMSKQQIESEILREEKNIRDCKSRWDYAGIELARLRRYRLMERRFELSQKGEEQTLYPLVLVWTREQQQYGLKQAKK